MKKRIIFIVIILMGISFITATLLTNNIYRNYYNNLIIESNKTSTISNSSSIAMMLETEAGSGEYYLSSDTSWPDSSEYTFNDNLSKCENGGTLEWDSTNEQVLMTGTKSDRCYIYFDVKVVTLAGAITYTSDGTDGLYYFDGEGDYINAELEAVDYSYRYVGGDYVLTSKAIDEGGYTTITNISADDTTGFIYFYCNGSKSYVGSNCSTSYTYYYTLAYENEANQYNTYQEALDQAVSDGYLTTDNIKNYICFGSDSETCESKNLYRIIGFFLNEEGEYEMKIIKADYADASMLGTDGDYRTTYSYMYSGHREIILSTYIYYWNSVNYTTTGTATGYYNDWSYSQLNTVNLNKNFYSTLGSTWKSMISEHTWIVGGGSLDDLSSGTADTAYNAEMINPSDQLGYTTYNASIGLLYVSDYAYATLPSYWTTVLGSYDSAKDSNWLYIGIVEWTITRSSTYTTHVYAINFHGKLSSNDVKNNYNNVRPCMYLSSSIQISSGTGTASDPYRLQT